VSGLRLLVRLAAFLLFLALAAAGLATAVFAFGSDDNMVSLPALARYLHLPELSDVVGDYLDALEADGPVAWWSVLAAVGAILFGLLLLAGAVVPRRERLVIFDEDERRGRLAARRRPLSQLAAALAEQQRGVTDASASVRAKRGGHGGRLRVRAWRARYARAEAVEQATAQALAPLAEAAGLRTRVQSLRGEGRKRVR